MRGVRLPLPAHFIFMTSNKTKIIATIGPSCENEETLEKMLRDVGKSLKRIEEGSYGVCKYCDKPIDEKRLLARPTSSACVECKKTLTDEA